MADLFDDLQTAVGDVYRLEKELGGGGMSRVFLAEETALNRRVVIKVLPPEMSAGVNVERFEREIRLAASLQHPHIVPLLTAGAKNGLLYYVMPYIEGESLRAKLSREGELPVRDVMHLLKEVVDALAHAHGQGVVHRDIKPDNVLLSGKHAVVTDFGVAKAVSASTGDHSLTSLGVALGTPAYMAPEQAAADPHVDHRADIYAVGVLAYEMLCGRPPFTSSSAQGLLAAHMTEAPDPVTKHRDTVPAALNELIMRCLQKKAADRWQRSEEMLAPLEGLATPSGGMTPTGTQPVTPEMLVRRNQPLRVAGMFALIGLGVVGVSYALMFQLGLPGWVFPATIALVVAGFPIVMIASRNERRRATAQVTGVTYATGEHWLTWRKTLTGGAFAFGALGVAAAGYSAMRVLGIGPVGTLVATGVLEERERLVLARFDNYTSDSTVAESVTELLRIDLSQSTAIDLVEPSQIGVVLERMERPSDVTITFDLATEIAQREGLKGVLGGEVRAVGDALVISAQLVAAGTGDVLLAARESASGAADIVSAVDRLSAKLRERIGESLRTIRADQPLAQVTTRSLEALRLYAASEGPFDLRDYPRAISLLEDAIAADSMFGMAYRRLGVTLSNMGGQRDSALAVITKAYELRDRVPERERYHVIAIYNILVEGDVNAGIAAYRTILDKFPNDRIALNNLAGQYVNRDQWSDAAALASRSIENGNAPALTYGTAAHALSHMERPDAADSVVDAFAERYAGNPDIRIWRFQLASARHDYDAAEAQADSLEEENRGNDGVLNTARFWRSGLARMRGQLTEARRLVALTRSDDDEDPVPDLAEALHDTLHILEDSVGLYVWFYNDPDRAVSRLNAFFDRYSMQDIEPDGRHYVQVSMAYGMAGEAARARAMLEARAADTEADDDADTTEAVLLIALAEGRGADAVAGLRTILDEATDFPMEAQFGLGLAHEVAGAPDSAIAAYERYVTIPYPHRFGSDRNMLPTAYRRLGALYEERGDIERAVEYYNRFLDLWENADADLQPQVRGVRSRVAELVGERG